MFNLSSFPQPVALVRMLLALLFVAGGLPAAAQAPAWQSAQAVAVATAAATGNSSTVTATATDAAGNVYLAGNFWNTVVLSGTTLTSLGFGDIFVAKFNPVTEQFVWAQRAGGVDGDNASALAVNGASVYVAGLFNSSIADFGATVLTNTNAGSSDVFIAKLTDAGSTGDFVWAQQAGGRSYDEAVALAVNGSSVYVTGIFNSSTVDFGATTLTSLGSYDAFVAKLTDTGSFVWAKQAGGTGDDRVTALAVNGTSVYIAGHFFSSTVDFGVTTLTNSNSQPFNPHSDIFIARLTDRGNFVWAKRAGGSDDDRATALAVRGTNVYVAGHFFSLTADFGSTTLSNAGFSNVFVAKLTDTSNFVWAQRAGGTNDDRAYALAVNGANVFVAGALGSPQASFGATTLANTGVYNVFVAKLTDAGSTGSFAWAQRAGGTTLDRVFTLALSGTSLYVAGATTSSPARFGPVSLVNITPGTSLGFLASLTDPTLTATASAAGVAFSLYPNPAHRTATLRLPAGTAPAPLTLCDAQGRTVRRYAAPVTPETTLDLHKLPAGLYLLRGPNFTQRLAVE